MQAFVGWFLAVSLDAIAVVVAINLTTKWQSERARAHRAGAAILGSAGGLVLLAPVWKVNRVPDLAGSVITLLATERSHRVSGVMSSVATTMKARQ